MEKINGEWYIAGCDASEPDLLKTEDDLLELLRAVGFLPLFANCIKGFSVEERTLASSWWSGDVQSDPWEWRISLSEHPEVAYGKFFDKKAGFIHRDFFPVVANYRRNGYDFDSLSDEGLVPHRAKKIMDVFGLNEEAVGNEIMSNELKEKAGFGKDGGEKNFDGILTELQMQTYLIVSSFRQRKNKNGVDYGWHIATMGTPETKWGYELIASGYREEPSASWDKITERICRFCPDAQEDQIRKVLGIRYPGAESPSLKPQKKATCKPSKPLWPENLLKEIGDVPLTLNEDQMEGLRHAIATLLKREQNVIKRHFEEYLSQKGISEIMGVSTSRIGQIKTKSLRKLRHPVRTNFIKYGLHGNEMRKHDIKNQCRDAQSRAEQLRILKEVRLADTGISSIVRDELHWIRLHTLGDVMEVMDNNPSELIKLDNISLAVVLNKLNDYGVDCSEAIRSLHLEQAARTRYLTELDISTRLYNILHDAGFQTVEQMETMIRNEPDKILGLRNLGPKTRAELLSVLNAAGIDTSPLINLLNSQTE